MGRIKLFFLINILFLSGCFSYCQSEYIGEIKKIKHKIIQQDGAFRHLPSEYTFIYLKD